MVNGLYLYSAFSATQSALQHKSAFTHSYTHSHTKGGWLLYKEPICSLGTHSHTFTPVVQLLGAVWGSVSCPRTLQHVDQRSWGLNHQLSDWQTTRSTYWAAAARVFVAYAFITYISTDSFLFHDISRIIHVCDLLIVRGHLLSYNLQSFLHSFTV